MYVHMTKSQKFTQLATYDLRCVPRVRCVWCTERVRYVPCVTRGVLSDLCS